MTNRGITTSLALGLCIAGRAAALPTAADFHYGTMFNGHSPQGTRAAHAVLLRWSDETPDRTNAEFVQKLFGPGAPNVADYFWAASGQTLDLINGGVFGPLAPIDDPDTVLNESTHYDSFDASNSDILYLALRGANGKYVSAFGGGGSGAGVSGSGDELREWETLALVGVSARDGLLYTGDVIALKTPNGTFLRGASGQDLMADGQGYAQSDRRYTIEKVGGSAGDGIVGGDQVVLRTGSPMRYLRVTNDGSAVRVDGTTPTGNSVFTLVKAGRDGLRLTRQVFDLLVQQGVDFAAKDTNHDGVVTDEEYLLWVIEMNLEPSHWGQVRNPAGRFRPAGASVDVDVPQAYVGEDSEIHTMAHEMAHVFGTIDLYGHDGVRNAAVSLMGAELEDLTYLDAWHRVRLGWIAPRIHSMADPGTTTFTLRMPESGGLQSTAEKQPVLLYQDPRYDLAARGGEFFMLEFRNGSAPSVTYDQGVSVSPRQPGLVLWQVKTDTQGGLLQIPAVGAAGTDSSLNTLAAPLAGSYPPYVRGNWELWSHEDCEIWPRHLDGTLANARIRIMTLVTPTSQAVTVCIATGGTPGSACGPCPTTAPSTSTSTTTTTSTSTSTTTGVVPTTTLTPTTAVPATSTTTTTLVESCESNTIDCEADRVRDVLTQALCTGRCNCDFDGRLAKIEAKMAGAQASPKRGACMRQVRAAEHLTKKLFAKTNRHACPQPAAVVSAVTVLRDRIESLRTSGFCAR